MATTYKSKKAAAKALKVYKKDFALKPVITRVQYTPNELIATWSKPKMPNFSTFSYEWYYKLPGKDAYIKAQSGTQANQSTTYSMPDNATIVKFQVKAISKTHQVKYKKKGKTVTETVKYWTDEWHPKTFSKTALTAPVPNIELDKTTLTVSLSNLDPLIQYVKFDIWQDNTKSYATELVKVNTSGQARYAEFEKTVPTGHSYTARCLVGRNKSNINSQWSEFSAATGIIPSPVKTLNNPIAMSSTSVKLTWTASTGADSYEIEYTNDIQQFDAGSPQSTTSETTTKIIEGLERGKRWYFRIRAVKDSYKTAWNPATGKNYKNIVLGQPPVAPTTYSISNTVRHNSIMSLYWIHNSQDGSAQVQGTVRLEFHTSDGVVTLYETKANPNYGDDLLENENLHFDIDTSDTGRVEHYPAGYWANKGVDFSRGLYLIWSVCTRGITGIDGPYSITRRIDVITPPSLGLSMTPSGTVNAFPIHIELSASPQTQEVLGFNLEITANENYDDADLTGEVVQVSEGSKIFSKFYFPEYIESEDQTVITDKKYYTYEDGIYIEVTEPTGNPSEKYYEKTHDISIDLGPSDVNLKSGASFRVSAAVSMSSGLSATADTIFEVLWEGLSEEAVPTAEFLPIQDKYVMGITPFCYNIESYTEPEGDDYDEDEEVDVALTADVVLSVYRLSPDGTLTEIETDIPNNGTQTVYDPHPTLNSSTYRIIAMDTETGELVFNDIDVSDPIEASGIIITWDEDFEPLESPTLSPDEVFDHEGYYGNVLLLPYNTSISESHSIDKTLVDYIGREHPVGYYGTQLGETASWKAEFAKYDRDVDPTSEYDTLKTLRALAVYTGDVYVREAYGTGYWASVDVSFDISYDSPVIPVTFTVTRVEGGV